MASSKIQVTRRALNAHPEYGVTIEDVAYPRDIVDTPATRLRYQNQTQREANKYGYVFALQFHTDAPIYIYPSHIVPIMNKCKDCYAVSLELRNTAGARVDNCSHTFITGDDKQPCETCGARPAVEDDTRISVSITSQCEMCNETDSVLFSGYKSIREAMTCASAELDGSECMSCDGQVRVISGRKIDECEIDIAPDDGVFGIGL